MAPQKQTEKEPFNFSSQWHISPAAPSLSDLSASRSRRPRDGLPGRRLPRQWWGRGSRHAGHSEPRKRRHGGAPKTRDPNLSCPWLVCWSQRCGCFGVGIGFSDKFGFLEVGVGRILSVSICNSSSRSCSALIVLRITIGFPVATFPSMPVLNHGPPHIPI